jgi:hypothetical protein
MILFSRPQRDDLTLRADRGRHPDFAVRSGKRCAETGRDRGEHVDLRPPRRLLPLPLLLPVTHSSISLPPANAPRDMAILAPRCAYVPPGGRTRTVGGSVRASELKYYGAWA